MRIALVDNCENTRKRTEELLRNCLHQHYIEADVQRFSSGKALMTRFTPDHFSLILLNVDDCDGRNIKIAHTIRASDVRCLIVFLSQSSEHMSEAFSCHAFDYIIKPLTHSRLLQLIGDVAHTLSFPGKSLSIRCQRQEILIPYRQIACLTANRNDIEIRDIRGNLWRTRAKFSDLAAALADDARFLDINRGVLVNMDYIATIDAHVCVLDNGMVFPLRVRGRRETRRKWIQYKTSHL